MKKTTLKKPTIFYFVLGGIVSFLVNLRGGKTISLPKRVGKYLLLSKISKRNRTKTYATGVYAYRGKNVLIKTWQGRMKDLEYYYLKNELIISYLLWNKTTKIHSMINFARPIDAIEGKNSFSVIFEYIEGKRLSEYTRSRQMHIFNKIVNSLYSISKTLTDEDVKKITKRSKAFYLTSLGIYTVITLILHTSKAKQIVSAFLKSLIFLFSIKVTHYVLAHRDLTPENIILKKSNIYLLDCQNTVLTLPGYDIAHLGIYSMVKDSKEKLISFAEFANYSFFIHYISLVSIHFNPYYQLPKRKTQFLQILI